VKLRRVLIVLGAAAGLLLGPAPARGQPKRDPADVELDLVKASLPARIDFFEIRGLCRTRTFVVLRELYFEPGQVVTFEQWKLAVTRLWNMQIFDRVAAHLEVRDGKRIAVFELEERWTLGPIFTFALGGDTFYLRVGALENNFLGRFLEVGGFYERFADYNGGQLSFRDPRFLGERLDFRVLADRLIRPRPGFAAQRTHARVELTTLTWEDRFRYGGGVDVFDDQMMAPFDPAQVPRVPPSIRAGVFDLQARLGRIDTVRLRQRGATIELRPAVGVTSSNVTPTYGMLWGEVRAFAMFGERWNLAFRAQAASITRAPVQQQIWIGGLDTVRGFPDSHIRARASVTANLEMRFTLFDSTWFAIMPVVFVDAAAAKEDAGGRVGLLSVGGGVRFLIPRLIATGLRVDGAMPLAETQRAGVTKTPGPALSVGVFQFF